jgi:hypothetical protein
LHLQVSIVLIDGCGRMAVGTRLHVLMLTLLAALLAAPVAFAV